MGNVLSQMPDTTMSMIFNSLTSASQNILKTYFAQGTQFPPYTTICVAVGASNKIYYGISYTNTTTNAPVHAEVVAMQNMIANNETKIVYMIMADINTGAFMIPCGQCLSYLISVNPENSQTQLVMPDRIFILSNLLMQTAPPPPQQTIMTYNNMTAPQSGNTPVSVQYPPNNNQPASIQNTQPQSQQLSQNTQVPASVQLTDENNPVPTLSKQTDEMGPMPAFPYSEQMPESIPFAQMMPAYRQTSPQMAASPASISSMPIPNPYASNNLRSSMQAGQTMSVKEQTQAADTDFIKQRIMSLTKNTGNLLDDEEQEPPVQLKPEKKSIFGKLTEQINQQITIGKK